MNNIMVLMWRLILKSKQLTNLDITTLLHQNKTWKHDLWEFLVSNQFGEI